MTFRLPTNIPLGTYFTDGLRAGPAYSELDSLKSDSNGNLIAGYYDRYGKGVLFSPFNTWNIVPYGSTVGNIVADAPVTGAGYLTLTQDTEATTKLLGQDGNFYVQFDYPRVVSVTVDGVDMPGSTNVIIFGTDWYGFPLQQTYIVEAVGTYPASLATNAKAFYTVTKVYIGAPTDVGGSISVQTTNTFGLPYALPETSYVSNFSWDGKLMNDQSGSVTLVTGEAVVETPAVLSSSVILTTHGDRNGTPTIDIGTSYIFDVTSRISFEIVSTNAADESTINWSIPNGGQNLLKAADVTVATALSGDVRGLVKLPEAGETWGPVPDGTRRLVISPYVFGADQFQNQLAYGNQPQGAGTVPPLSKDSLYGRDQYYTGQV